MKVQVAAVSSDDQDRLRALFELYCYDFSEIVGLDVDESGRFQPPPLDVYWADSRRYAFLVRVDEKLAGFALVQKGSRLTGNDAVHDMVEFFVLRRYRRRGVGEQVAAWLFDRFRGPWEVRQKAENIAATTFWREAIDRYTAGAFDEVSWDDTSWCGPVQRFDSSLAAGVTQ